MERTKEQQKEFETEITNLSAMKTGVTSLIHSYRTGNDDDFDGVNRMIEEFNNKMAEFEEKWDVDIDEPEIEVLAETERRAKEPEKVSLPEIKQPEPEEVYEEEPQIQAQEPEQSASEKPFMVRREEEIEKPQPKVEEAPVAKKPAKEAVQIDPEELLRQETSRVEAAVRPQVQQKPKNPQNQNKPVQQQPKSEKPAPKQNNPQPKPQQPKQQEERPVQPAPVQMNEHIGEPQVAPGDWKGAYEYLKAEFDNVVSQMAKLERELQKAQVDKDRYFEALVRASTMVARDHTNRNVKGWIEQFVWETYEQYVDKKTGRPS